MTPDETLATIARDLNDAPEPAARAVRYQALVTDTNHRIRETADALLGADASPLSFEAYKAECFPKAAAR
jgi:hypothetical protein